MGKGEGSGSGKGTGLGSGSGEGSGEDYKGKTERLAVPAMPAPAAVICCVLNFLIPGFGTICAGFSNFCCSRNEDMTSGERFSSCCLSFGIGLLQLLTTAFCLLGWIWSCVWGGFFIVTSVEYFHKNKVDSNQQGRVIGQTQGAVIVTQPGANVPTYVSQPAGPGYHGNYSSQTAYVPPQANYVQPAAPTHQQLYPPAPSSQIH